MLKRVKMESQEFYRRLIEGYKNGTSTDAELEVFMQLLREGKLDQYLLESMDEEVAMTDDTPSRGLLQRWSGVLVRIPYAAACVLLLTLGVVLYYNSDSRAKKTDLVENGHDIAPGGNRAILTLASGSVIALDQLADGETVMQAGMTIRKTSEGQLIYEATAEDTEEVSVAYNTITTPNGGQYQITLPDGTRVWLNSASSLRYPVRFNGNSRQVALTGEGYFEVSADESSPFVVACQNQIVRVTGTVFNINAYPEEKSVKTTLLEGRVTVVSEHDKKSVLLKPGERASLENEKFTVKAIDTDQVIDWKNGDFIFENEDIHSIMRRVSRWFDVEVVYENGFQPDIGFFGQVSRSKNLSEVLQILELTGAVHFRIEGKTVTVLP